MSRSFRAALIPFVVFGLCPFWPSVADACSCAQPPPPRQALEGATAVFTGKVVKVEQVELERRVTVEVEKDLKAAGGRQVVVRTGLGGGDCGYGFKEGERYLIYAHGEKDAPATSICTRTCHIDDAEQDLKELDPPAAAAGASR